MTYTTNPYADLSQLYSLLDASATTQSSDGIWYQEVLLEAQDYIDKELGYSFQTDGTTGSPATRLYDGNAEDQVRQPHVLFVGSEHIQSITQVLETTFQIVLAGGVFISSNPTTTDITQDILLQPNNSQVGYWKMVRKSGIPFYAGLQNYQVKGVFGRPSIPPAISRATLRLASHWIKMRDTNYADQLLEQGLVRLKYTKQCPDDVQQIIDKYKPRLFTVGASYG